MAYKTNSAPYVRAKKSTLQIMIELAIALGILWIAAITTTFIKLGTGYGLKSIFLMVVALVTTAACDVITTVLKNKKDKTLGPKILHDLIYNNSWITAMIFTLICPVWTSYYVIVIGSIFSTLIVKNVFGGFGKNIFNPAALGRIFVSMCFDLSAPKDITAGLDAATGSTITGVVNSAQGWLGSFPIDGFSTWDILLGNYFGTMGESFTILILVLGIILAIRGVINWRAPAFYLGTMSVAALLVGLILGFENPLLYVVFHIGLGGAAFGAIFMLTDPVTTPTSPFGNCLVGIFAALLTFLMRIATNNVEGVVFSIALVNMFSPTIDLFITGKTHKNTAVKSAVTFGSSAFAFALIITSAWFCNGGREVNSINGIARPEYDELTSYTTSMKFMETNNYEFSQYEKEVNDPLLNTFGGCKNVYGIVNDAKEEVGVMYCVKGIVTINADGYDIPKQTTMYVAIDINARKVMGVSIVEGGATGNPYLGNISGALEDFDYGNKDILTEVPGNLSTGATYSATGVLELTQKAFDLFNSQYAA